MIYSVDNSKALSFEIWALRFELFFFFVLFHPRKFSLVLCLTSNTSSQSLLITHKNSFYSSGYKRATINSFDGISVHYPEEYDEISCLFLTSSLISTQELFGCQNYACPHKYQLLLENTSIWCVYLFFFSLTLFLFFSFVKCSQNWSLCLHTQCIQKCTWSLIVLFCFSSLFVALRAISSTFIVSLIVLFLLTYSLGSVEIP